MVYECGSIYGCLAKSWAGHDCQICECRLFLLIYVIMLFIFAISEYLAAHTPLNQTQSSLFALIGAIHI